MKHRTRSEFDANLALQQSHSHRQTLHARATAPRWHGLTRAALTIATCAAIGVMLALSF